MLRILCVLAALAFAAASSFAQCPGDWSRIPGEFGRTGNVSALTSWDPDGAGPEPARLIAAGSFTYAGGVPAHYIAAWDGGSWFPMGPGAAGAVGSLLTLGPELYASGGFTQGPIVRWTGSQWAPLPNVPTGAGVSLGSYLGRLTIGSSQGVVMWDGSAWLPVGGNSPLDIARVQEVGSHLFAATWNSNPQLVHEFDGSAWRQIGSFTAINWPPSAYISALGSFNGDLLLGGYFHLINGAPAPGYGLVRWNGTNWSSFGSFDGTPQSFVVLGGQLFAGGGWVWRYDSGNWVQIAATNPDTGVSALIAFNGALIAGGDFDTLDQAPAAGIARFDATAWNALGTGLLGRAYASAYPIGTLDGDLVVGGYFTSIDGRPASAAARWNGTEWTPMSAAAPTGMVFERGLELAGQFYASGHYRSGGGNASAVLRYGGQQWDLIPTSSTTDLLTVHDGQLVARVYTPSGLLVERWDGSQWLPFGTQTIPGGIAGAASIQGTLWMAAQYTNPAIYRWQASAWQAVTSVQGQGFYTAYLNAVGEYNGELVVGGYFARAGNAPANSIAAFSGNTWHALAEGLSGSSFLPEVRYMVAAQGLLAVAGDFGLAGPGIAFWDGHQWSAPPSPGPYTRLGKHQNQIVATSTYDTGDGSRPALSIYRPPTCYANCDCSTAPPVLNALDFGCFLNRFAAGDPYANCDQSTSPPVLNVLDFVCFLNRFAAGCP